VPDFLPFPGIRYAQDHDLSAVCAPPYDVIDPAERDALLRRDEHNSVRLILPDTYVQAAGAFRSWQTEGVLVADDGPSYSLYRMTYADHDGSERATTGVIGALAVDGEAGEILPHEETLARAKQDRLELLRATRANLDPIWGLSLAPGLSRLLRTEARPDAVCRDDDGTRHELFRARDPALLAAIADAVGPRPLVLADGHHRLETARAYRRERADAGADDPGADFVMAFVVELAPEQLDVRAIHRLLRGPAATALRDSLDDRFDVTPTGPISPAGVAALERAMAEHGALGLIDTAGLALLRPRPELESALRSLPPAVRDVDASRFELGVVPLLADTEVGYRHDAAAVAGAVADGAADAAVLLRPVGVDRIRAAAEAGLRFPQKTTFFAPKPRTGMVFRSLDR
jgi:uncharacterized protein (DUF1015 family)